MASNPLNSDEKASLSSIERSFAHLGGDDAARFLDAIIDQLPAMVFLKTAEDLRFVRFNRAGEELLGLSRDIMVGRSDHDFFPKEQADFFVAKDREVLEGKEVVDIPEEPIQTPSGTRWLHTRKIPLLDARGRATHLLGISVDITERREAEAVIRQEKRTAEEALSRTQQQLVHAQKMEAIGRLAGGIAHDFNNILSVILTCAEVSLGEVDQDHTLFPELSEIRNAAQRAADLTRQLLAFSRQQVLQPRVIDLNEVIRNMERMLQRILDGNIELTVATQTKIGKVRADPSKVEQVVMNLVVNARDAMPAGGKLLIETTRVELDDAFTRDHVGTHPGPHVMLAVSDTGTGIEADVLSRIFEPFYTTKDKSKGTGLGLSTALGIVEQSGGAMYAYSEPGRGSCFKVYLPTFEGTDPSDRGARKDPRGHGETVLLCEDDDSVRRALVEVLASAGYKLLVAESPQDALAIARTHVGPIQLLITDVVMPELGGRALADELLNHRPETRVLFMSGYTDEAVVRHGVLDAGTHFLQKPITPSALRAKVREVLESRRSVTGSS